MSYQDIVYEKKDTIGTIMLNRPQKLNACTRSMAGEIRSAIEEAGKDPDVRVLVIKAAGRAFCAGIDIGEVMAGNDLTKGPKGSVLEAPAGGLDLALRQFDKPSIAAVNGPAIGMGLDLAICCDMRVAAESASFQMPYQMRGSICSASAYYLPRLVGLAKAYEIIYLGESYGAQEAQRMGLVYKVVPNEQLDSAADQLAARIAKASPTALQFTKQALWLGMETDLRKTLDYVRMARTAQELCDDLDEGFNAFKEKRAPVFKGRRVLRL